MKSELEAIHRLASPPMGELVLSVAVGRVLGGRAALLRWAKTLREAAERLEKLARA